MYKLCQAIEQAGSQVPASELSDPLYPARHGLWWAMVLGTSPHCSIPHEEPPEPGTCERHRGFAASSQKLHRARRFRERHVGILMCPSVLETRSAPSIPDIIPGAKASLLRKSPDLTMIACMIHTEEIKHGFK